MSHTYTNISGNRGLPTTHDMFLAEKEPDAAPLGLGNRRCDPSPTASAVLSSFYVWIHVGPQLITALSERRGSGEAGGEGLTRCSPGGRQLPP